MKKVNINSVIIENVDYRDSPFYSDAFISYAEFEDGTELTKLECKSYLDDNYFILVELIEKYIQNNMILKTKN
jgi:hypothetical protein